MDAIFKDTISENCSNLNVRFNLMVMHELCDHVIINKCWQDTKSFFIGIESNDNGDDPK